MDLERKILRATWLDYNDGLYFVTICTDNHIPYFGRIKDNAMTYFAIGRYALQQLENFHIYHPEVKILEQIVMPNHIHAILKIRTNNESRIITNVKRLELRQAPILSKCISAYKSSITRFANEQNIQFRWQRSYYDHAIRHTGEYRKISEYINTNVERWINDKYYNE